MKIDTAIGYEFEVCFGGHLFRICICNTYYIFVPVFE